MICYLDRTFCIRLECRNVRCDRNVTPEVEDRADGMGLPLCVLDMRTDDCGYIPPCVICGSELGDACTCHNEEMP